MSLEQIVAKVGGRDVTRGELKTAFEAVENKSNWKLPIDTVVSLDPYTLALVAEAVVFFTGSVPSFELLGGTTTDKIGKFRVKAVGYYNAVGA